MKVDIGTKAAQFLFWEYINVIFVAVYLLSLKKNGMGTPDTPRKPTCSNKSKKKKWLPPTLRSIYMPPAQKDPNLSNKPDGA